MLCRSLFVLFAAIYKFSHSPLNESTYQRMYDYGLIQIKSRQWEKGNFMWEFCYLLTNYSVKDIGRKDHILPVLLISDKKEIFVETYSISKYIYFHSIYFTNVITFPMASTIPQIALYSLLKVHRYYVFNSHNHVYQML